MKKITYTEEWKDSYGVTRIYGYSPEGYCVWINLEDCKRQYDAKGYKVLRALP